MRRAAPPTSASGRASMRARMIAMTMLAIAATTTAARTTVVTDSSYIFWAWSAESPASTMSWRKISRPTTVMPMARIVSPSAAEASAASAIRVAMPRPITGSCPGCAIPDAADRRDIARHLGVVAEFVAQPADVDVDGPVEDVRLVSPVDRVEQLIAGEDAAIGFEDRLEKSELDPGRRDRRARAGDVVAVGIEDE